MTWNAATPSSVTAVAAGGAAAGSGGRLDWAQVQQSLRKQVAEEDYETWLAPLTLDVVDARGVTLTVPTSFIQSWVEQHYREIVATSVEGQLGRPVAVNIRVAPVFHSMQAPKAAAEKVPADVPAPQVADDEAAGSRFDPRYTFATFVTGNSNEFAAMAAQRVAQEGGFNPLFMYGGVGLGKTHLMHAIGWDIGARRPAEKILYLSSEQFANRYVRAMRERDLLKFRERVRNVDVLMVDDIQFVCGKDGFQEEFFHTFNALVGAGKQVILTADKSPHDLANLDDRLRSRFASGLTVRVEPPGVEMRLAILQSKAAQLGLELPTEVLESLAVTIASNVRELEGALNRLVAQSRLMGAAITLEFAREQLSDLYRLHTRVTTVDDIQKAVADYFKIRVADMHSPRRSRHVARPRQVAMYLCKQLTNKSFPDIGRAFGGKDHTTVMHGVKAIQSLMESDGELAEHVGVLEGMLGGRRG
ncbi:MAG: chromosomal replication initiator protein DnaA [Pseudomonadaceae bacterium]|nr:chromosomal replication initiator protein DnaA [Pseudomonadaceae bacterium]